MGKRRLIFTEQTTILLYFLHIQTEEKMMLETCGDQYREYMKKTAGIIPKF